jgi:prepilin-type N-terminal cleavage/methylation domain-containing protein
MGAPRCGFTLVEMVLVVLVLALAASLAVPQSDVVDQARVDAAASEITQACRFAQGAARGTGGMFAVRIDTSAQAMRVYQLNAQGAEDTGKPVMHPVDKNVYRIAFGAGALGATLVSAAIKYKGMAAGTVLSYGPDGVPAAIAPDGKLTQLESAGQVTLRHGRVVRQLSIDAATGRVTS